MKPGLRRLISFKKSGTTFWVNPTKFETTQPSKLIQPVNHYAVLSVSINKGQEQTFPSEV
jgi:hypothetical protein